MPNSALGATFSRFKHWRCLPFVLFVFPVQLTSVIKNKRQSGFTRGVALLQHSHGRRRFGLSVRSSRMSRSFRLLLEKTGGGGIASVGNYLEPALLLLFAFFFDFLDFFVLC